MFGFGKVAVDGRVDESFVVGVLGGLNGLWSGVMGLFDVVFDGVLGFVGV